jgi:uncharacterized membrane protein YtjA (UPF0391 family)
MRGMDRAPRDGTPRKMHRVSLIMRANCAGRVIDLPSFVSATAFHRSDFGHFGAVGPIQANKNQIMLEFAFFFFALAIIAALLAFSGLAGLAALTAKVLCGAFLVLFIIATIRRHPRL